MSENKVDFEEFSRKTKESFKEVKDRMKDVIAILGHPNLTSANYLDFKGIVSETGVYFNAVVRRIQEVKEVFNNQNLTSGKYSDFTKFFSETETSFNEVDTLVQDAETELDNQTLRPHPTPHFVGFAREITKGLAEVSQNIWEAKAAFNNMNLMVGKHSDFAAFAEKTEAHFNEVVGHIKRAKIALGCSGIKGGVGSFLLSYVERILAPILFISPKRRETSENNDVSVAVYERLMLRYAILSRMEHLEKQYLFHRELNGKGAQSASNIELGAPGSTYIIKKAKDDGKSLECCCVNKPDQDHNSLAYRLATTDLFVEKAIIYLEKDYEDYKSWGKSLTKLSFLPLVIGVLVSAFIGYYLYFPHVLSQFFPLPSPPPPPSPDKLSECLAGIVCFIQLNNSDWPGIVSKFVAAFTFYGFLVLVSVSCWRHTKVMMDQLERLKERRHSLRQGRLFIHLNEGKVSIDELEKAFEWNVSRGNAFATMQTEASAPWGSVVKEALQGIANAFKFGKEPQK